MKKLFNLALTAALSLSLFGCGAGNTEAPASTVNSQEPLASAPTAQNTQKTEADNTLTVWCWDTETNIYAINEAAKIYQKENQEFRLNAANIPWQELQTKITAATSNQNDTLPDIILMPDSAFQQNILNYPQIFADLTNSGIDFGKFPNAKKAYSIAEGKNYGVPFDNSAAFMALRTDILEQAGYTIKDFTNISWDDFIKKGEVVLSKTGKPLLSAVANDSDFVMTMLQSTGSSLFNADGTINITNNAELKQVLKVYSELIKKGICVEVNNWDEYIEAFNSGAIGGAINNYNILGYIQTVSDQAGKWGITNLPKLDTANATNYSNNGGTGWAVMSGSKNKELAFDFLSKTFGSSVELYETILPDSGIIGAYLPAGQSGAYTKAQDFFGGQAIYSDISAYAAKVPEIITGAYYNEAREAVGAAVTIVAAGADEVQALKEAEDTVNSQIK